MKFLSNIPRGLLIFLGGIVVVVVIIVGYKFLFTPSSAGTNTGQKDFFSALFPFGNSAQPSGSGDEASSTPLSNQKQTGEVPLLRHITDKIVSGAWFMEAASSTTPPIIRYMQRENGNMFQTPADSFNETRISNTTVPGVLELYAATDANLIVRYLDDSGVVGNFYGFVNATSSQQSFNALPIRRFDRISLQKDSSSILTVTSTNGTGRVDVSKADGTKLQTIFVSPITSWVPLQGGSRNFLETAPSAAALGYLYEIKNGALSKIAGGLAGFTASVSPSGRFIAYSGNSANGFSFSVLDTKTNATYASPIHAFAMKCAWVPNREPVLFCAVPKNPAPLAYPDDWLLGSATFADDAWVIDPIHQSVYFIGTLADENGTTIDAENISIDKSGSYALFTNKKDLTAWSLKILEFVARVGG